MTPPLQGIRIVEFEGIGPGPLAGRMLADMGAQVTVIARGQRVAVADQLGGDKPSPLRRGKVIVPLDLKQPDDLAEAMRLVDGADALIEGNRPGVMERLGLGPADCAARNPKLVYGRMTGWGQSGPLAQTAGHDLNYVALTGILSLSARPGEAPMIPPTVVGDAGGALGLAFGIVCALLDARASGRGRVVDGAIVDMVAMLGSIAVWVRNNGQLDGPTPSPFHQSPFYDVYGCADGGFITIGALEPQFYALLLERLGMTDVDPAAQYDHAAWPALKQRFTRLFASEPRAHWDALLGGTDVCYAPVLSIAEAARHPHNVARGVFIAQEDGALDVAGAPRFAPSGAA
ncbi:MULTISPECIES: CaiB/BaiF CoA transferase family protein [Cupriavidus]|uniref:CoA transferase n=1 Tax=Cupriavidus metallidurans TaxID=119219 RepID=A0A482IUD1_9BURK|nr:MULTISPECIES: CaiB/BaiF CoA-transferase family protein [Cupriavidus]KWR84866.1 CoA-transferase [Cupriavidus sp. SHE]QBP10799.1 CoA transferase [Cupriavidus metallidurans]QWC87860.1 CoA transferase [Cupriavidus metallidurans]